MKIRKLPCVARTQCFEAWRRGRATTCCEQAIGGLLVFAERPPYRRPPEQPVPCRGRPYHGRMPARPQRVNFGSGSEYEAAAGYSRAVRVGPHVVVAGTTGSGEDVVAQTRDALRRIDSALQDAGASRADVIRTRMYVTDISAWRDIAAVHAEVFGDISPVATMVEVSALIEPHLLVEIEADAYLEPQRTR